jgi:alpha-galactosidase
MGWEITEEGNDVLIRLSVRNITGERIRIKKLVPFLVCGEQGGDIAVAGQLNQAYLLSLERNFYDIKPTWLYDALYQRKFFSSEMMICLYDRSSESALNMAFVTTADMFGIFDVKFDSFLNPDKFSAYCEADNIPLAVNREISSEKLLVNIDHTARTGLSGSAARIHKEMRSNINLKPVVGWSTWDYYFGGISEENILENVEFLARHKQEIPVEYIQMDAGYTIETEYEWEKWNGNFPHGPKWLVDRIRAKGVKAGIWLVPFWARKGSVIAEAHPDWLVKDRDGSPFSPGGNLSVLDGTHPEVQEYLHKLAETITCKWGFEYIKIDGASKIGMAKGIRYRKNMTSCEAYRQGIEAFRAGMKKGTFFMGGVFGPSIGIVDAMRIGGDVGARWDWNKIPGIHLGERDRYHGSGYIKRTICSSLNAAFMNRRLWINDGDYLVVRDDRSELSFSEAQVWATVTGLYGGSVILGDRMATLSQPRLEILKKIFPVLNIAAVPIDFLKKDIPEILAADLDISNEHWKIIALFNYADVPALKTLVFTDIDLDKKMEYHVFGFWKQKYHGIFMNSVSIPLEAHSCELIAVRENKCVPQFLGTDIHISQGKVEIESTEFAENILTFKTAKVGRNGNIFVFVPDEFEPGNGLIKHADNIWKFAVECDGKTIELAFKKRKQ